MNVAAPVAHSPRVYLGTVGVFFGAGIVSLSQRVVSVGLPDLRGALGLGVDEAAWIPTVANMALMFMGPFTVYLGALLGPRRVLLFAAPIFAIVSLLAPFTQSLRALLVLQAIGGMASGTFYPLSLSFALTNLPSRYVIYGIGVYSLEILGTLSLATPLQALYIAHLSWRWMFWQSAIAVPLMMFCIYVSIPPKPKTSASAPKASWQGFFFLSVSLSLLVGALEQGERLNWFDSGTIVTMVGAAAFLLGVATFRRWRSPNPLVNLSFLANRSTLLLGAGIFFLRFVLLAVVILIPGYLAVIQGYAPLQTGAVLLSLAGPEIVFALLAAQLMRRIDGRLVAALGFLAVAVACLMNAHLSSVWAGENFSRPQLVLAGGLAFTFVGLLGLITQRVLESGALLRPVNVLTFAAFFQTVRLFGGVVGAAFMQRVIKVRGAFHASELGFAVGSGQPLADERLQALVAALGPSSSSPEEAQGRAAATMAREAAQQASTLTYVDGFIIVAWACAAALVAIACTRATKKIYFDSTAMTSSATPPS